MKKDQFNPKKVQILILRGLLNLPYILIAMNVEISAACARKIWNRLKIRLKMNSHENSKQVISEVEKIITTFNLTFSARSLINHLFDFLKNPGKNYPYNLFIQQKTNIEKCLRSDSLQDRLIGQLFVFQQASYNWEQAEEFIRKAIQRKEPSILSTRIKAILPLVARDGKYKEVFKLVNKNKDFYEIGDFLYNTLFCEILEKNNPDASSYKDNEETRDSITMLFVKYFYKAQEEGKYIPLKLFYLLSLRIGTLYNKMLPLIIINFFSRYHHILNTPKGFKETLSNEEQEHYQDLKEFLKYEREEITPYAIIEAVKNLDPHQSKNLDKILKENNIIYCSLNKKFIQILNYNFIKYRIHHDILLGINKQFIKKRGSSKLSPLDFTGTETEPLFDCPISYINIFHMIYKNLPKKNLGDLLDIIRYFIVDQACH